MNMKPYIKETLVDQIELTELDLHVENELMGENPEGHDYTFLPDLDATQYPWKDGDYIPVSMLTDTVKELTEKGSTHIQIYQHSDHHGYYFTGVKIEDVTEEEGMNEEMKQLKEIIRNKEYRYQRDLHELEQQEKEINDLYSKYENLKNDKE